MRNNSKHLRSNSGRYNKVLHAVWSEVHPDEELGYIAMVNVTTSWQFTR